MMVPMIIKKIFIRIFTKYVPSAALLPAFLTGCLRAVRSHTSLMHALVRLHRNPFHHFSHDVLKSLADGLIGPASPLVIHGIPFSIFHGCDELYHGFRTFLAPAPSLMFHAIAVYTMACLTRSGLYQMDFFQLLSLIQ